MMPLMRLLFGWLGLVLLLSQVQKSRAFSSSSSAGIARRQRPPSSSCCTARPLPTRHSSISSSTTRLHLFGWKKKEDKNDAVAKGEDGVATAQQSPPLASVVAVAGGEEGPAVPATPPLDDDPPAAVIAAEASAAPPAPPATAQERAAKLRADAERARLEAQRMDAELTLRKIEALEKKVQRKKTTVTAAAATNSSRTSVKDNADDNDSAKLQQEISRLSQKFKEQTTPGAAAPSSTTDTKNGATSSSSSSFSSSSAVAALYGRSQGVVWPRFVDTADGPSKMLTELDDLLRKMPKFIKLLMVEETKEFVDFNATAIDDAEKVMQVFARLMRGDMGVFKIKEPRFTKTELDQAVRDVQEIQKAMVEDPAIIKDAEEGKLRDGLVSILSGEDDTVISSALLALVVARNSTGNIEDLARLRLEYKYYVNEGFLRIITSENDLSQETEKALYKAASEEWYLKPFFRDAGDGNATALSLLDNMMDSMFPKSTTQLRVQNPMLPPQAQVERLYSDVLPQTLFRATSRPKPVLGGFVIKGSSIPQKDERYGEKVMDSIEEQLKQRKYADLAGIMTISYLPDFLFIEEADGDFFAVRDSNPPLLYICGPTISRVARPIQLSIVSAVGLATTLYLSLYPFLLNRGIAKRVDEELAMIDAGVMAPDLSWLSELSLPLFVTFCSIQVLHEVAHGVVASANGIKTYPPTFVPSILTGITSSVTSLKSPPKNLNAMFDFAIVGPLTGMAASAFALAWGSQLTTMMDPSTFPALPLEILRQSTLGGGIINNVMGGGVLNVPTSLLGTPAIAEMTVALHPLAVAGYIGLMVNALNLLPVGTTDGGRVALTIFGRQLKSSIGSFALVVLFWFGVSGSDLFLYYFSFCIAFQSGNEIPARNEVDNLSLSRIVLASAAYVVAALALVPFQ